MAAERTAQSTDELLVGCWGLASSSYRNPEQMEPRITSSQCIVRVPVDLEVETKRLTLDRNVIKRIEGTWWRAQCDATAFDAAAITSENASLDTMSMRGEAV